MSQVRVRFAPSPTGTLHVGGARTALFNWLFARHYKGTFVLRIEDTDLARSTKGSVDEILDSLNWLGLNWDEGPIYQSQRLFIYQEFAAKLIEDGKAYKSDEGRGPEQAVLFKIPPEKVVFHDALRGDVTFDNSLQKDQVLLKSDGMPTYQFACVVDDALMNITHVIRGDDHLSNTPKQIPIYEALDFPLPQFIHVPMICGPDGSRLSKRHGATAVSAYIEMGILPECLFNFLSLLGWSPGEDIEVLSQQQTIKRFKTERLNKKSAIFDLKKLLWMNGQYLKKLPRSQFLRKGSEFLKSKQKEMLSDEICQRGLQSVQSRIQVFEELTTDYDYFFFKSHVIDSDAVKKYLKTKESFSILAQIKEVLASLETFDEGSCEETIRRLAETLQLKAGALIHPLRVAVTGKSVSPGMFETLGALGKETTLERIKKTIEDHEFSQ